MIDRVTLAALADSLIPAGEGMPSATEAGVAGPLLDELLRVRPDLAAPLGSIIAACAGEPPVEALARLGRDEPAAFEVLTTAVAGAYFLSRDVTERLGYHGQRGRPINTAPDPELEALLAAARARGPVFRPTPDQVRRVVTDMNDAPTAHIQAATSHGDGRGPSANTAFLDRIVPVPDSVSPALQDLLLRRTEQSPAPLPFPTPVPICLGRANSGRSAETPFEVAPDVDGRRIECLVSGATPPNVRDAWATLELRSILDHEVVVIS